MSVSQLKLQQLNYFLDAAETKNFTRTAENNFTSQSNISYAIRALENSLGVPLFIRGDNEVTLTKYGETFLPYVRDALERLEAGMKNIEDMSDKLSGTVKIGYSYVFSLGEIPSLYRYLYSEFEKTGKKIELLSEMAHINANSTCVDDMVLNGTCDLGITSARARDGLLEHKITQQELVLLVSKNHPLAARDSVSLTEVRDEPFIFLDGDNNLLGYYVHMFDREGIKPKQLNPGLDWLQILVQVSAGRCMTISMKNDYLNQNIKMLELNSPLKMRDVYLTWSKTRELSRAAKYVRDMIIDYYESQLLE